MPMAGFTRRLLRVCWLTAALLLVGAAVLFSLFRLALPLAGQYRAEIQHWVSGALGRPVLIGGIDARWRGLGPELKLEDVRLLSADGRQSLLTLGEVFIGIDMGAVLRHWNLQPSVVRVVGDSLAVRRDADGALYIQGVKARSTAGSPTPPSAALAWLFSRERLEVQFENFEWQDRRGTQRDVRLSNVKLALRNDGDRHELTGAATMPAAWGRHVAFAIDAHGPAAAPRAWQGQLYVKAEGIVVAQLASALQGSTVGVRDGAANLELWGDLRDGRLARMAGTVAVHDLQIAANTTPQSQVRDYPLLSANVRWERRGKGWLLQGEDVQVSRDQRTWPSTRVAVSYQPADASAPAKLRAAATYLRVEDVLPLVLSSGLLPQTTAAALTHLDPRGSLNGIVAAAELGATPHVEVAARLDDVGITPWRKIPGLSGVTGRLRATERGGYLTVDARPASLTMPWLFRAPLRVTSVNGAIRWERTADGWSASVPKVSIVSPDGTGQAAGEMRWSPDKGPFLDLRVAFQNGNGAQVASYLPVGRMPPKAVAWLDRALVAGRVPSGKMVYRGWTRDFPFDGGTGHFNIAFDVEDGTLDYHEGWPQIQGIFGHVEFENQTMRITADRGHIFGSRIVQATVTIPDLKQHDPNLEVDSSVLVPVADGIKFLREVPLTEAFRARLAALHATGNAKLDFAMRLKLKKGVLPTLRGRVSLDGASLGSADWSPRITKLHGDVDFSDAVIQARGVRGELLGNPVQIDVHVPIGPARKRGGPGEVILAGRVERAALVQLGAPLVARHVSGAAAVKVLWRPPLAAGQRSTVELTSDLEGMTVALPRPLGKAAKERQPLSIEVDVRRADVHDVRVRYGDELDAAVRLRKTNDRFVVSRGEVSLGGGPAKLPDTRGLRVVGKVDELDVPRWRTALGGWGERWDLSAGPLDTIAVDIGRLSVFGRAFSNVRLALTKRSDRWQGKVKADGIDGVVRVPLHAGTLPAQASFENLRLGQAQPGSGAPQAWPDPRRVPPLEITAEHLFFGQTDLGQLDLHTIPVKGGLQVTRFSLRGNNIKVDIHGDWLGTQHKSRCSVAVDASAADLGNVLKTLGYAEGIKGGTLSANGHIRWPGPPGELDAGGLAGEVYVVIRNGRIVNLDPGAGRIFGLLSFQALPRHLMFDFRDFFLKGFTFDKIKGNFRLQRGNAYTDDLYVDGPAARIDIIGRTGLSRHDYDQLVTVTPHITSTLPLAGWAAGGPVVGAVMLFFDKMFGKRIDAGSGVRYHVTGNWDDPQVKRLTIIKRSRSAPATPEPNSVQP